MEIDLLVAKRIQPHLKLTGVCWKLDETYVKVKGVWHYMHRAIDKSRQTLGWMSSCKPNKKTTIKFFYYLISMLRSIA